MHDTASWEIQHTVAGGPAQLFTGYGPVTVLEGQVCVVQYPGLLGGLDGIVQLIIGAKDVVGRTDIVGATGTQHTVVLGVVGFVA